VSTNSSNTESLQNLATHTGILLLAVKIINISKKNARNTAEIAEWLKELNKNLKGRST